MDFSQSTALIALLLLLLGGIAHAGIRQPILPMLIRPTTRTLFLFCFGLWIFADDAIGIFVPAVLIAGLLLTLIPFGRTPAALVRDFGTLCLSTGLLVCLSAATDLFSFYFCAELVILCTSLASDERWESGDKIRLYGSSLFVGCGLLMLSCGAGTAELNLLGERLLDRVERAEFILQQATEGLHALAVKAGAICLLVGLAWRLGFFPFRARGLTNEPAFGTMLTRYVVAVSATLYLFEIVPRLHGQEELLQVLLLCFGSLTLLRATRESLRSNRLTPRLNQFYLASLSLIWIVLAQDFPLSRRDPASLIGLPHGMIAGQWELWSATFSWILLFAILQRANRLGERLIERDDLAGLARVSRGTALALAVTLLSWMGFPLLTGFWSHWGIVAGAFQLGASASDAATGYFLVGLLTLGCLAALLAMAIEDVSGMFARAAFRPRTPAPAALGLWPMIVVVLLLLLGGLSPALFF